MVARGKPVSAAPFSRQTKGANMRYTHLFALVGSLFATMHVTQPSVAQANPVRYVWRCFSNGPCGWVATNVVTAFLVQRGYDCYYNGQCSILREPPKDKNNRKENNTQSPQQNRPGQRDSYSLPSDDDDDDDE